MYTETYYRVTLHHEFLSHIVFELEERFVSNPSHSIAIGLFHLLPSECVYLGDDVGMPEDLTTVVDLFEDDLPHPVMFMTKYVCFVGKEVEGIFNI